MDAIDRKDWAEARRVLLGLWEIAQTYDVAASLSEVEFRLGHFAASARYMKFAIANTPPMESPARLERYKSALEELRPKVATVHVIMSDAVTRFTIDGTVPPPLGSSGETFLDPGPHTLEAENAAGSAVSKTVVAVAGERYEVELKVSQRTAPPLAPSATTATASPSGILLPRPGGNARESELNLVPVYVGAGLAVSGAVVALGFGIAANGARSDWRDLTRERLSGLCSEGSSAPGCTDIRETYDRQRRSADFARVGLGVFAGASVATLAYVLLWPRDREDSRADLEVVPVVSAQSIGVVGNF
jgi:hypothetical protein